VLSLLRRIGEGDRSLRWWRDAHVRFFSRQASADGVVFDGRTKVVLERFVVVWPRPDGSRSIV
jgi:uncharacterized protein YhfF